MSHPCPAEAGRIPLTGDRYQTWRASRHAIDLETGGGGFSSRIAVVAHASAAAKCRSALGALDPLQCGNLWFPPENSGRFQTKSTKT